MELSTSNIKKILIFFQNKSFLIFQETKTLKRNFLIFKQRKTLKNFLYFKKQLSELEKIKKSVRKKNSYVSINEAF